ncbi:MAG: hypothetical protein AAB368_12810 [bacterium]
MGGKARTETFRYEIRNLGKVSDGLRERIAALMLDRVYLPLCDALEGIAFRSVQIAMPSE